MMLRQPEEEPYDTGIACPLCLVGSDERCLTKSGFPYSPSHAARRKAAREKGVVLTRHEPPSRQQPPMEPEDRTRIARMKLALWYIEKAGGVAEARLYFDRACQALEQPEPEPEAGVS